MIQVHKLNGQDVVLNAELIEWIEPHGVETVIGLANGNRMIVTESVDDIVNRCIEYRRSVYQGRPYVPDYLKASSTPSPLAGGGER